MEPIQTPIKVTEIVETQTSDTIAVAPDNIIYLSEDQQPVALVEPLPHGLAYMLSRLVSIVLHPFLIPTWTVILLLFADTIMNGVPIRLKWLFVSVVMLNTIVVPLLFLLMMRILGYLHSMSLDNRRDRIVPLAVVAICYVVCAFMISDALVAFLIREFLFVAIACVVLAFTVNLFWKISLHMIAAGGALAVLILVNVSGFGSMFWALIIAVLLTGALASARLYLGSHNPWQVAAGFVGGFAVAAITMLIL